VKTNTPYLYMGNYLYFYPHGTGFNSPRFSLRYIVYDTELEEFEYRGGAPNNPAHVDTIRSRAEHGQCVVYNAIISHAPVIEFNNDGPAIVVYDIARPVWRHGLSITECIRVLEEDEIIDIYARLENDQVRI